MPVYPSSKKLHDVTDINGYNNFFLGSGSVYDYCLEMDLSKILSPRHLVELLRGKGSKRVVMLNFFLFIIILFVG